MSDEYHTDLLVNEEQKSQDEQSAPAPRYSHAYDIAFSLESTAADGYVSDEELFAALERRIAELRSNPGEVQEACGCPFDTHLIEDF